MRPIAGAAATSFTVLTLLFAGAGAAFATDDPSGTSTTSTSTSDSDHSDGTAGTAGSYDRPQPESTADQNSGGANGQCPGGAYCSTRDGSPSRNGNGDGKATGKPCAGCVGKADNKNPKGQYPNGSDPNAGYECDRNHGVGQGNPAHTGCVGEQTSDQGCPSDSSMTGTSGDCAAAPGSHGDAGAPGIGGATPVVAGTSAGTGHSRPAAVLGVQATRPGSQATRPGSRAAAGPLAALLPDTGAGATLSLLLAVGAALVLAGAVVLLRRRTARS